MEQEFSDETEVKVGEELLKTEVRPTAVRLGLDGVFNVDENIVVRATADYRASGSGTSGYGRGLGVAGAVPRHSLRKQGPGRTE